MLNEEDDTFASVSWDEQPNDHQQQQPFAFPDKQHSDRRHSTGNINNDSPETNQSSSFLTVQVKLPVRELEGTKDSFVSYLVTAQVLSQIIILSHNPN